MTIPVSLGSWEAEYAAELFVKAYNDTGYAAAYITAFKSEDDLLRGFSDLIKYGWLEPFNDGTSAAFCSSNRGRWQLNVEAMEKIKREKPSILTR